MRTTHAWLCAIALLICQPVVAADLDESIKALRSVKAKGAGNVRAKAAWKEISQADAAQLPTILAGMDGASLLVANWFRAAVEAVADRQIRSGKQLPEDALEDFARNTKHSPRGRRLAFELLSRVDKSAPARIIPTLRNDPSLELRRDAIAMALARAAKIAAQGDKDAARQLYQETFVSARDIDQIKDIASKLEKLGHKTDLPTHFGFVMQWNLIGPFDNRDKGGFDVAYPPEKEIKLNAEYEGMKGKVKWTQHATDDPFGAVDLNKALAKHKGAVCYAYAEFDAAEARDCELRIGCINGNKVWLNGRLVTATHVYHAGMDIDQYAGPGKLQIGKNQILVKICQNEQTEPWAQRWQFQLRVCDALGTAILARDRQIPKAAANREQPTGFAKVAR